MLNTFKRRQQHELSSAAWPMEDSTGSESRKRKRTMEEVLNALPQPKITASLHNMPEHFRSTRRSLDHEQKRSETARFAAAQHRQLVSRPHVSKALPTVRFSALPQPKGSSSRGSSSSSSQVAPRNRRPHSPTWWDDIVSQNDAKLKSEAKRARAAQEMEQSACSAGDIQVLEQRRFNRNQALRAAWKADEWLIAKAMADQRDKSDDGEEVFGFDDPAS